MIQRVKFSQILKEKNTMCYSDSFLWYSEDIFVFVMHPYIWVNQSYAFILTPQKEKKKERDRDEKDTDKCILWEI